MEAAGGNGRSTRPPSADYGQELYRDPYVTVFFDEPAGLFRLVRSAALYPDIEALQHSYAEVCRAFDRAGRVRRSLLADMRAATGRNDPSFEQAMLQIRPRLLNGFQRIGVLVATAIGVMQVRRVTHADNVEQMISTDEAELLEKLT
jgi:hypothetical protein